MIIVDSSVWIDLFHGTQTPQTDWIKEVLKHQSIRLTDLILCEVLQGIRDDRLYPEIRKVFLGYEILPMGGTALALASAENHRKLQKRALPFAKQLTA